MYAPTPSECLPCGSVYWATGASTATVYHETYFCWDDNSNESTNRFPDRGALAMPDDWFPVDVPVLVGKPWHFRLIIQRRHPVRIRSPTWRAQSLGQVVETP